MDKLKTRAFILKSSNDYQAWRIETYYHLLGQGWYSHVDDSDPRPDGASQPAQQEWDREDAKALAFVNGLMSPTFKLQFKASNSLKDMWNRLESQFQPRGFNQRYSALLKLVQTTLSSCDDNIDQYCSKFTEARDDQILANGEKYTSNNLTEDNLITLFVGGLTQSPTFETFVLHFRQRERMTTLEETMSLAREEARMAARANPHQATVLSTQSKPPNKKRKHRGNCPQHPRMSHDEEDCWTLHPDKRPKKHENPLGWKHGALSALTVDALLTERVSQWAVDTGASLHFCNDLRLFADLASCDPITVRGSTGQYSSSKRGSVYLRLRSRDRKTQPMKLVDVLYVPTLPVNLISASLLKKQGIYFSTLDNTLRLVKNHQEIGSAQDSMGLNMLQLGKHQALDAVACPTVAQVKPDVVLWHQRLSHAGLSQLKMTQNHSTGMEQVSFMESLVCEPCHLAKSQRTVSRKESTAQLISYELILSSVILLVVLLTNSLNLTTNVEAQKIIYFLFPLFPLYIIFFIGCIAETNRAPFDLAEAESELVSGFMTEHSAGIFVFFFLAEYASIVLICIFAVILFIGGFLVSVTSQFLIISGLISSLSLGFKTCIMIFIFI